MPEAPAPGLPPRIETIQSRSRPSRSRWDLQALWSSHQADGSLGPALDDPWGARHRPDWAARGLVIWPRGGQWRCLTLDLACPEEWRQLQVPAPVAQARLVLRWWADQVELRVNGKPVHAGDLFDTTCRWLLPVCWWQGTVLQLELRLRSPLHDDGALIASLLELEPLDPQDPAALLAETKAELAQLRGGQPLRGGVHVLGHAHLDLAWLWPVADTWQAAERTFASALDLIERFEELHFGHSTPALYAWLEQNRPALFARLQQAVAAGRFEPINGPWVETDCVLISSASLLRQFQLGQHYSAATFPGLEHPLAWLPDSFGFAAGLPAVAHSTGVRWFCTHKLFWNTTNPFPHRLFRWRSRCGAEVLALMTAPIGTDGDPVAMERYRLAWQAASGVEEALWLPGVGDHGGGPTAEMLEQLRLWQLQPEAAPQRHGGLRAYLAQLEPLAPRLPVWRDELYLELHRGCATSRPDQKRHNRTLERLLREADLAAALAGVKGVSQDGAVEPADWRPLLFQQFHDILPGTSIPEVFEQAEPQWRAARRSACKQRDRSLHSWLGAGPGWWVAQLQPLPPRARTQRLPPGIWSQGGIDLPAQAARAGGQWVQLPSLAGVEALPLARTPASSTPAPFQPASAAAVQAPVWVEGRRCGNGLVSFALGPGGLEQLWDAVGQPQLAGPLAWRRYADRGEFWDAWDIAANYREHPLDWGWQGEPTWLEQGPLCASFLWRGRCGTSAVRLEGRLLAHTPWLELVLSVDWRQRHELLRLEIPLAQSAQRWAADTSGGVLERPAQAVTAQEQARWEVPTISWLASVAAGGDGLAVLLDGPQGVSASPEQLGVSLLRAPTWPDPGADNGLQRLRLALLPCPSGWSHAQVPQQAVAFREPLWLRPAVAQGRPEERQAFPPLGEGLLLLGCRPSGEAGVVVITVQNCSPVRRRLEIGRGWQLLERLDGLEQPVPLDRLPAGDPWLLTPWSLGFWRLQTALDRAQSS